MVYKRKGPGIFWSGEEKELFFRLLARYGMSRLDDIVQGMGGSKGRLEIIQYYTILKKDTAYIRKKLKFKRRRKALIKMEDIPIAYEMSESFIAMEEAQAHLIIAYEATKISDETRRLKLLLPNPNVSIIDEKVCFELSQLYRNNARFDSGRTPKLTTKTLLMLEDLVRCYTTRLLLALATKKVEEACQNNRYFDVEHKTQAPVSRTDVYEAIKQVTGRRYTLDQYFKHLYQLFSDDESALSQEVQSGYNGGLIQPFTYSDKDQQADYDARLRKQREETQSSIHISQILPSNEDSERLQVTENIIVTDMEANKDGINDSFELDQTDLLNSRIHEHALLTYFAGEWGLQLLDEVDQEMELDTETAEDGMSGDDRSYDDKSDDITGNNPDRSESNSGELNGQTTIPIDPALIGEVSDNSVRKPSQSPLEHVLQFLSTLGSELESDTDLSAT
ncbi:uncharacterized protein KQ657_001463 [Scheffersomyces spartinae]|uniref:Myb-like domain-containing protein n=1 Tax=Scheffersomyces spartinae TaxID=45513 RepID=A0A9P7V7J8_9ASCO|nr:uncharacterized protein KQ657_001463 [Scheffersomyces spartinae]KAG7192682.1 hypothetical protein KQ657_001463 [Scheffersomyces spartinae]